MNSAWQSVVQDMVNDRSASSEDEDDDENEDNEDDKNEISKKKETPKKVF